jgi:hypothetical protein
MIFYYLVIFWLPLHQIKYYLTGNQTEPFLLKNLGFKVFLPFASTEDTDNDEVVMWLILSSNWWAHKLRISMSISPLLLLNWKLVIDKLRLCACFPKDISCHLLSSASKWNIKFAVSCLRSDWDVIKRFVPKPYKIHFISVPSTDFHVHFIVYFPASRNRTNA